MLSVFEEEEDAFFRVPGFYTALKHLTKEPITTSVFIHVTKMI